MTERQGFFRKAMDALIEARMRQARREIERFNGTESRRRRIDL